jgi:hypothetical protein
MRAFFDHGKLIPKTPYRKDNKQSPETRWQGTGRYLQRAPTAEIGTFSLLFQLFFVNDTEIEQNLQTREDALAECTSREREKPG